MPPIQTQQPIPSQIPPQTPPKPITTICRLGIKFEPVSKMGKSLNFAFKRVSSTHPTLDRTDGIDCVARVTSKNEWANDTVIDYFMNALIKLSKPDYKVEAVSALWFREGKIIDRQLTNRSEQAKKRFTNFRQANVILMPINLKSHWYLMAIHRDSAGTFSVYAVDGFNNVKKHHELFENAKQFLARVYPGQSLTIKNESLNIPRQNNLVDCGFIVCLIAKLFSEGLKGIEKIKSLAKQSHTICDYQQTRSLVLSILNNYVKSEAEPVSPSRVIVLS